MAQLAGVAGDHRAPGAEEGRQGARHVPLGGFVHDRQIEQAGPERQQSSKIGQRGHPNRKGPQQQLDVGLGELREAELAGGTGFE